MKHQIKILLLLMLLTALPAPLAAQSVGVKTNLLYDATATVNLGVELRLAPRVTLDVSGNLNAWNINRHRWRHWLAQPEVRYWFCERFQGNFIAFHAVGGQYNIGNIGGLKDFPGTSLSHLGRYRYQGWGAGAGIAYGHAWILGTHWNLEAEIGVGWVYTRYDKFPCAECGTKEKRNATHNYVGPTKAAVNLVYLF